MAEYHPNESQFANVTWRPQVRRPGDSDHYHGRGDVYDGHAEADEAVRPQVIREEAYVEQEEGTDDYVYQTDPATSTVRGGEANGGIYRSPPSEGVDRDPDPPNKGNPTDVYITDAPRVYRANGRAETSSGSVKPTGYRTGLAEDGASLKTQYRKSDGTWIDALEIDGAGETVKAFGSEVGGGQAEYIDTYDSAGSAVIGGVATPVLMDTERTNTSGGNMSLSGGGVSITDDGTYEITADASANEPSPSTSNVKWSIEVDTGAGYVALAGADGYSEHETGVASEQTATMRGSVTVSGGGGASIRIVGLLIGGGGTPTTVGGGSRLTVRKL